MPEIVKLHEYRLLKQREFFIKLYRFLNSNMDNRFDEVQERLRESLTELFLVSSRDPVYINYFSMPIITFIVTIVVKNSDLGCFFPTILKIDDKENICMFKKTLIKILETFDEGYKFKENRKAFEKGIEKIIDSLYEQLIEIIPKEIVII